MHDLRPPGDDRVLRIRFAADPASVPGARRFVAERLRALGHDALVDDATLCVSELAGNAALHANSTYIEVEVVDLENVIRLVVEDDGPAPLDSIAPRTSLPGLDAEFDQELDDLDALLSAPATGRGLAIVSVLASDWGVEALDSGKRVWAELMPETAAPSAAQSAAQTTSGHRGTSAEIRTSTSRSAPPEELPEGWVLVRLTGCPVELSLQQDQHLDELVRELTLMNVARARGEASDLGHRLEAILQAPAHARAAGRRQAQAARARGERLVDVEMAIPREFSREVVRLQEAVQQADVLCEERRLLTLTSSPALRAFRAWMTEEITNQTERGTEPVTWDDWLAHR